MGDVIAGRQGNARRGRRALSCVRAIVAVALFGATAPAAVAQQGASGGFVVASKASDDIQRWDYWGRTRPLPVYKLAWSKDDAVCRSIVAALNAAGPAPASLYGDPIFLRWRENPDNPRVPDNELEPFAEWMEVSFFNDGRPAIALKITLPDDYSAPEELYVIPDVEYYKSLKVRLEAEFLSDPRILRPLKPFIAAEFAKIIDLPKTMKNYKYWSRWAIFDRQEVNLARVNNDVYAVIRMPIFEYVLVVTFSDRRTGHPVCLIGPTKFLN